MSSCNYAFKANEISEFDANPGPAPPHADFKHWVSPQANFKHWVWPFYMVLVIVFRDPLQNQLVVGNRVKKQKRNPKKHVHGNFQLCKWNQWNIKNFMPPPGAWRPLWEPQGGPRPPVIVRGTIKAKGTRLFSGNVWKAKKDHHNHDHVKLRLSI